MVLKEGGSELPFTQARTRLGTPTSPAVSPPPLKCQGLPLRCGIKHWAPRLPQTTPARPGPARPGVSVDLLSTC